MEEKTNSSDIWDSERSDFSYHPKGDLDKKSRVNLSAYQQNPFETTSSKKSIDDKSSYSPIIEDDLCTTHKIRFDILCLECRSKVCPSCAIFAGHKTHELIQIEEAVGMMEERTEALTDTYTKITSVRREVLSDEDLETMITNQMNNQLSDLYRQVDFMFEEISSQIQNRRTRLIKEIQDRILMMQNACVKFLRAKMSETARKSDLWCISTREKLDYIAKETSEGELPIDLLNGLSSQQIRQAGKQMLDEMLEAREQLQRKLEEMLCKKVTVEFNIKKSNFEKVLESLFSVGVRSIDDDHPILTAPIRPQSFGAPSKIDTTQSFLRIIEGECELTDPSLLKDINNQSLGDPFAHLTMIQQLQTQPSQTLTIRKKDRSKTPVGRRETAYVKRSSPLQKSRKKKVKKVLLALSHTSSNMQSQKALSNANNNSTIKRDNRSPSPNQKRPGSKSKLSKLPQKYQSVITLLKEDALETADFTGAELGDEALSLLTPFIVKSQNLRVLKLVKNKISDSGATQFFKQVLGEQNKDQYSLPHNVLASVNLSNNILTDKIVDFILNFTLKNTETLHVQSLRQIYFNQNLINGQRVKKKTEELKKLGINLQI